MSIEHLENLVFSNNAKYKLDNILSGLITGDVNISVKYDGTPSIVFGWDNDNLLLLSTKSFFNKTPKFFSSRDEIVASNASNPSLRSKLLLCWDALSYIKPIDRGLMFNADLLCVDGTDQALDRHGTSKPNTVVYDFSDNQQILDAEITVALHSAFYIQNDYTVVDGDVKSISSWFDCESWFTELKRHELNIYCINPTLNIQTTNIENFSRDTRTAISDLITDIDQIQDSIGNDLLVIIKRFQNFCIKHKFDYNSCDLAWERRLIAYINLECSRLMDTVKLEKTKNEKMNFFDSILDSYNRESVSKLMKIQRSLMDLTKQIMGDINHPHAGEGYVIEDQEEAFKLIDRTDFSYKNFIGSRNV